MKIIVKAKTKAKVTKVERLEQVEIDFNIDKDKRETKLVTYKVSVKEAPINGLANKAIIKALAEYFETAPARICLISGQSSKQKVFEIE